MSEEKCVRLSQGFKLKRWKKEKKYRDATGGEKYSYLPVVGDTPVDVLQLLTTNGIEAYL